MTMNLSFCPSDNDLISTAFGSYEHYTNFNLDFDFILNGVSNFMD